VVASVYDQVVWPTPPANSKNKQLWATLDGKEKALQRLSLQITARQDKHILQTFGASFVETFLPLGLHIQGKCVLRVPL